MRGETVVATSATRQLVGTYVPHTRNIDRRNPLSRRNTHQRPTSRVTTHKVKHLYGAKTFR